MLISSKWENPIVASSFAGSTFAGWTLTFYYDCGIGASFYEDCSHQFDFDFR